MSGFFSAAILGGAVAGMGSVVPFRSGWAYPFAVKAATTAREFHSKYIQQQHSSWLNGQASGPIASFGYFRSIIDEVAQMDTSLDYWRYIRERALISMNERSLRIARMVCNYTQRSTVQCSDSLLAQQDQGIDG